MPVLRALCAPSVILILAFLAFSAVTVSAQQLPIPLGFQEEPQPPQVLRITMEEAKQRALANNNLLNLANLNVQAKAYAVKAAKADYFPKIAGTEMYLHFNDELGSVLSTQGRTIAGPLGRPLLVFPPTTVNAAVLNQDTSATLITAVQPISDLLKVKQGVRIAQADKQIAEAQLHKGIRDLVSGVQQLYWGLLFLQKMHAGALEGLRGAELFAKSGAVEMRIAILEGKQSLQQLEKQIASTQEQLRALLDLPPCTHLELVEPPYPVVPYRCAEEVIAAALAHSPEIQEARSTLFKVEAAIKAGKLDYVPSVAIMGGYVNQTGASYIQPNFGFIGAVGTFTFVDWGKRRNVINERLTLGQMATLKLREAEDDVRQKARKYLRELSESAEAIKMATEMLELRKEAQKKATTPAAAKNPTELLAATKARMEAEVEVIKASLAYRQAYLNLISLTSPL